MTELAIQTPAELENERTELETWAKTLVVSSAEDYQFAALRLQELKSNHQKIVDYFAPLKEAAWKTHKGIVAKEKEALWPLDTSEVLVKKAMLTYQQEEQRKAEAERRRLQAIADEQARKEREKAEAEAAKQREIERQAREKAEEARRKAAEADAAERKRLLAEAQAAERKAAAAAVKVEARQEEAAAAVAPVIHVAAEAPKVASVSTRKTWKFRVVDAAKVPREYMLVDEVKLGKLARALQDGARVEGIEFYAEESLASKGF